MFANNDNEKIIKTYASLLRDIREAAAEKKVDPRKERQKERFAKEYERSGMKYPYSTADTRKADEKEARAQIRRMTGNLSDKERKAMRAAKVKANNKLISRIIGDNKYK